MSLRYKLLILMISLTGLSLAAFLGLAVHLFSEDKIAYIFETSSANSKSLANQVKTDLQMYSAQMNFFVTGFDFGKKTFDRNSHDIFDKNDNVLAVYLNKWDGKSFENIASMTKAELTPDRDKIFSPVVAQVQSQAYRDGLSFHTADVNSIVFSQKVVMAGDTNSYFITLVERESSLATLLKKSPIYDNFIVKSDGQVLLQSKEIQVPTLAGWEFFNKASADSLPEGTEETKDISGKESISSYTKLGIADLISVSSVEKSLALQAIYSLLLKAALFFIALVSLSSVLAIFFSKQVTSQLSVLDAATTELAGGNFDVNLDIQSSDEVGRLSKNFNTMVTKISGLMKDNVEKARMEKELETAKVVQDTLFPEKNSQIDRVQISGFYEPASECGGDWWYYFKSGTKVFVCIGDATGHGASAALITSAARSAVSLIETSPTLTPASFLQLLNRAIYVSAKGKIQMTFFVACIDSEKSKLTYATASHTAPYLIKKSSEPIKKDDLIPLLGESQGLRLGQEINSRYTEVTIDFNAGDLVFVYTDGLTDIESPAAKVWDERGLLKSLTVAATENSEPKSVVETVADKSGAFRDGAALKDDVTFFAFQFT